MARRGVHAHKIACMSGARLEEMSMHTILKPECNVVLEASFKILQNFETTKQLGEFSFKH
jgi:hypothetical protein